MRPAKAHPCPNDDRRLTADSPFPTCSSTTEGRRRALIPSVVPRLSPYPPPRRSMFPFCFPAAWVPYRPMGPFLAASNAGFRVPRPKGCGRRQAHRCSASTLRNESALWAANAPYKKKRPPKRPLEISNKTLCTYVGREGLNTLTCMFYLTVRRLLRLPQRNSKVQRLRLRNYA